MLTTQTEKILGLIEQANHAGWFLPHANICWVSERHNNLHLDSNGRLHSPDSLACSYPDGWGVYAWHGVRVPEQVILKPQTITTKQVISEQNAEIKRVMMERYAGAKEARDGIAKFVLDAGAKTLKKRGNYELLEFQTDHISSGRMRFVKMICPSTGACYLLRVAPNTETVEQGMNWIKQSKDYFGTIEHQT